MEEKEPTLRDVMNALLQHHEESNRRTTRLENHVVKLWKHVNGSPPSDDRSLPPPTDGPLEAQVSSHSLEIQALRSDIIQTNNKIEQASVKIEQVKGISSATQNETAKQSNFLGIGMKGLQFLLSPAGRKSVTAYSTAIVALIAAVASAYGAMHHQVPPLAPTHVEASK